MSTLVITIISLCAIGVVSAVILYFVAQKFKVEEDPRIDIVEGLLPGANCGGCGYPGCRGLAEAAVKSETMEGILCPVGGAETMNKVAAALGREVKAQAPKIAVVRCNDDKCVACGACVKACPRNIIELRNKGPKDRRVFVSCVNKDKGGVARKACKAACIGCGKCAKECPFDAITVENNLAYIDYSKCRLCRKCVGVCPTGAIHEVNFPPRKTETEAEKNQQTTIKPTNSCATPGQTATDPVGKAPVSASPQVESIEAQKTPETDSKN